MFDNLVKFADGVLGGNRVLSGGVALMLIGGVMAGFRKLPGWLFQRFIQSVTFSAFIGDSDYLIKWLWGWLSSRSYIFPVRHFILRAVQDTSNRNSLYRDKMLFTPIPGTYFFFYRGKLSWATFSRDRIEKENSLVAYNEFLLLGVLFGDESCLRNMILDAKSEFELGVATGCNG